MGGVDGGETEGHKQYVWPLWEWSPPSPSPNKGILWVLLIVALIRAVTVPMDARRSDLQSSSYGLISRIEQSGCLAIEPQSICNVTHNRVCALTASGYGTKQ